MIGSALAAAAIALLLGQERFAAAIFVLFLTALLIQRLWRYLRYQKATAQLLQAGAALRRQLGTLKAQDATNLLQTDAEAAAIFAALDPLAQQAIRSGIRMKALLEEGLVRPEERERTLRTLASIFYDRPPDREDMESLLAQDKPDQPEDS